MQLEKSNILTLEFATEYGIWANITSKDTINTATLEYSTEYGSWYGLSGAGTNSNFLMWFA